MNNQKLKKYSKNILIFLSGTAIVFVRHSIPVLAAETTISRAQAKQAAIDSLKKLINVGFDVITVIGVILFVWGVYELVLSFKDENADSKVKSITKMSTGILFVTLKTILKTTGQFKTYL